MAEAMAIVGMGTSLLGGIVQGNAQKEAGYAQSQMYQYQSGVAQINKEISKQNADWAYAVGERQAVQYGITAAQRMGAIKAGQSASGVDVNSGSAVDVRKSQKFIDDLSMGEIRTNAAKTAYDYQVQATSFDNQAKLYNMAAKNSAKAGEIAQMATFIGSASSVASKWSQASQSFGWNILGPKTGSSLHNSGYAIG